MWFRSPHSQHIKDWEAGDCRPVIPCCVMTKDMVCVLGQHGQRLHLHKWETVINGNFRHHKKKVKLFSFIWSLTLPLSARAPFTWGQKEDLSQQVPTGISMGKTYHTFSTWFFHSGGMGLGDPGSSFQPYVSFCCRLQRDRYRANIDASTTC